MKCAVHADVEATGFCRNCGKALCPACAREVRGALYCEPCLAGLVSMPVAEQPGTRGDAHPGVALALGFIPGLGAVYNGEYVKALTHVVIFGGIIAALNAGLPNGYDAFLGIALGCFYFYMPLEAYRTARARQAGEAAPASLVEAGARRPMGAIILVALGILLLLGNFGLLRWDWLAKGWPLALIVLGVWLMINRMRAQS
jgi:hypothetical protein